MPIPLPAGLAFFFEILLPGVFGGIVAYPLLPEWARVTSGGAGLLGFISLCLLIGVLPRLAINHLVLFWIGVYWPGFIRGHAIKNLQFAVFRAEAALADPKADNWTTGRSRIFLDLIPEVNQKKVVLSPTVLGNGLFTFVMRLYEFYHPGQAPSPNQIATREVTRLTIQAWFSLRQDVRSDVAESLAVGSGMVSFSVVAAVFSFIYIALGLLATPINWASVERGLAVVILARAAHVIGRGQFLSSLDTVRILIEPQVPPKGSP